MTDLFGTYRSQSTRGLARIDSSKYPDTNKDFEANVRRLNGFVDYISQYLQQMQKGVDQATQDPITSLRDFALDLGQLLGGGELLYGIDLGDLQYYLPALAAMFGFDADQPFPLNLFYAAEHFLLGYIVPLDSFAFAIEDIIDGWAEALGINEEWIQALHDLLEAIQEFGVSIEDLLTSLLDILGIFGITPGGDTGLFAEIWHGVSVLLGSLSLKDIGTLTDPLFHAVAPWIEDLAIAVEALNKIIQSFSGGVTDLTGILNFSQLFTNIIPDWTLADPEGDPLAIWAQIFSLGLKPLDFFADLGYIFGDILGGEDPQAAIDALIQHVISIPDTLLDLVTAVIDQLLLVPDILLGLLTGLIDLLVTVPEILTNLLTALISMLMELPEVLTTLLSGLIDLLVSIPETLVQLLAGLIDALVSTPELLSKLLTGLIELLISLPDILLSLLSSLVELLISTPTILIDLAEAIWAEIINIPDLLIDLADQLISSGSGLLGGDSPLNALNLFNLVPPDLLGHISVSHIGSAITNLITDPDFLDVASLSQIPGWTHNLTGGFGGKGAMFTTATGTVKELFGNLIPVSEGQIVPMSGMAKWSGLVGTGTPIQLGVTGYQGGAAIIQQILASHNTTPPTTDWITLSGEFPVPAGIDSIRTRLTVGSGATAGTVGFSKLSATKTGAMLQRLIRGTNVGEFLPDDITHLFTGIVSNTVEILDRVLQGDFEGLVSTIVGDVQEGFEDVGDRLNSFLDDFSPLNGSNIFGEILDDFVPGIGSINDNLMNNLANLSGSGFTHLQVGQALKTQATAMTTMSAQLAQVTNQLLSLGVSIIDDFGRLSNTGLGADWLTHLLNNNGNIATPGGNSASWIPGAGNITNQFLSIFNGVISKTHTDIQNIVAVLSGQAQILGKGSTLLAGFNDLWARVSNTSTSLANVTGTRLRFGANGSVSIDNFINGVLTVPIASMPAGSITPPGPGAIIGLVAGYLGDLQTFGAMIGNSTVLIGNAPSNTPAGPNYLGNGIGGQATGANGAAGYPVHTAAPAPVFQYTAMDGGATGAPGASG